MIILFRRLHCKDCDSFQDGDRQIHGRENLDAYLTETEKTVDAWRKFQSDSCYIDEDGEIC